MQRAYDQVIHDVALQNLPVIFCLDRAGLVGEDGPTHHGVFDMAYLRCIPNVTIFAPINEVELRNIMYTSQLGTLSGPIAIRYPRGRGVTLNWKQPFESIAIGTGKQLKEGSLAAVLSIGTIGNHVMEGVNDLDIAHFDMRFVKPLDMELLHHIFKTYNLIITVEDGCIIGGFGSAILEFASKYDYKNQIHVLGIPDTFIEHGPISDLQNDIGLNPKGIKAYIEKLL